MNLTQALKTLKENKFICERTEEIDYKELENQVLRRTEEISKNCDFPIVDVYNMNTDRFVCKCMLVKKIDVISNDEKTYYAAVRMKEQGKENTVTGLEGSVCYKYNDSKRVYEDRTGYGFINNEEIKKETVIALANKIDSAMKKRYSESVKVDKAVKFLRENNYIVENTDSLVYDSIYGKLAKALDAEGFDYEYINDEPVEYTDYIKIYDNDVEIYNENNGTFDVLVIGDDDTKSFPDDDPNVVEKIIDYIKSIKV